MNKYHGVLLSLLIGLATPCFASGLDEVTPSEDEHADIYTGHATPGECNQLAEYVQEAGKSLLHHYNCDALGFALCTIRCAPSKGPMMANSILNDANNSWLLRSTEW